MQNKKEKIKEIIRRLHEGEDPKKIKDDFKEVLGDTTSTDIARIEQELIKEGLPHEEIRKLCDVHLEIFKDSIKKEEAEIDPNHPLNVLKQEHKAILEISDSLLKLVESIEKQGSFKKSKKLLDRLKEIDNHFIESEKHYVKEENVLFPYIEKHGIKEPPAIMWTDHNDIRDLKKGLHDLVENWNNYKFEPFVNKLKEQSKSLSGMISSHFYKEDSILYKLSLDVIEDIEWKEIKQQFGEIGYCSFIPEKIRIKAGAARGKKAKLGPGKIDFDTGSLALKEIEAVFNSLPVDITFVDKDDNVRYFNQPGERIFPRTKAVIGRSVKNCHPRESVDKVEQILNDFRDGKRDSAEFWINMKGRIIYIRYFPVRDDKNNYLGCLEATQDITDIQKLKGEKRLLD